MLQLRMEIFHPNYLEELLRIQRGADALKKESSRDASTYHSVRISRGNHLLPPSIENNSDLKNSRFSGHDAVRDIVHDFEQKEKKRKKAEFVIEEMIHFEKRLLEILRILKNISDKICESNCYRSNCTFREIFKEIPSLYQLHVHISDGLDKAKESKNYALPSVFVDDKEIPYLNIYKSFVCHYAVNYPNLAQLYSKDKEFNALCRSVVTTSKFEEQRIQDVCGMYFGVHSSLTRFKLLITKLEEALTRDNPLMEDVKKAVKVLDNLLVHSEGEMLRQGKVSEAQSVLAKLDGRELNLRHIPPLLLEGPCKKIPRRSTHNRILDRYLFLFSGYLVLTEPQSSAGRYQVKSEMELAGMTLSEIQEDDEILVPHCFRIKAKEICLELSFQNEDEKSRWWDAIQQAISQERGRNGSVISLSAQTNQSHIPSSGETATEWVKDEQSTMCAECHCEFTILNRRHHCRACGKVFCGSCSAYRAPIAFLNGKLKRVCVVDYYLINRDLKPPNASIMEGIIRRTQKEEAHEESGHLFWCPFRQGTWSMKPTVRSSNSSIQHKYVHFDPSRSSNPMNSYYSSSRLRSARHLTKLKSLDAVQSSSQDSQSSPDNDSLSSDTSSHSEAQRSGSLASSLSNLSFCVCRVFCVLQSDTLLSIYAAKADTKAKDQMTLIGTRLFYLDTDNPVPYGRPRSASWTLLTSVADKQLDPEKPHVKRANSPPTTNSDSEVKTPCSSNSSGQTPKSPVHIKISHFEGGASGTLVRSTADLLSTIHKGSNPMYRNTRPPPLGPKPNISLTNLTSVGSRKQHETSKSPVNASQETHETGDCGREDCNYREARPSNTVGSSAGRRLMIPKEAPQVMMRQEENKRDNFSVDKSQKVKSVSSRFDQSEIEKQLESISPTVLGILRDNLGFLLLPMNTDCLAHYFEAPSPEIRTKWIDIIRRTCIKYMSR
ncbi:unnamed protein product [Calicophoron daubneyi]|uniref:Uncharacterized protein n=1 Tax=Calicophoron daubneyi TaxID=300641 RepID=A0AAV2TI96_CALDB